MILRNFLILLFVLAGCGKAVEKAAIPTNPPPEKGNPEMTTVLCDLPPPEKAFPEEVDMVALENQLVTKGIQGWVHAAVKDQYLFVFTWRHPKSFFVNIQMPISATDPQVIQSLSSLKRHDEIWIKGEFFKNNAPIQHIKVSEIQMIKPYTGPGSDYIYESSVPPEIMGNTTMVAEVHIVTNGGSVLVVEFKDRILPVLVTKPELTQKLYRGDKIELSYRVDMSPNRPPHLVLNVLAPEPIRLIEQIACGHNEPIELEGNLVMFPQSPQIRFNVFALRTEDAQGVARDYTLVNFENMELFEQIRQRLQGSWDLMEYTAENDRNKLINRRITVKVKGLKNVISADQANPQILINSMDDLKVQLN